MGTRPERREERSINGYSSAVEITVHDTNELVHYSKALFIGNSGGGTTLRVRMVGEDSTTNVDFVIDTASRDIILPLECKIILNTGTDVDDIVALW